MGPPSRRSSRAERRYTALSLSATRPVYDLCARVCAMCVVCVCARVPVPVAVAAPRPQQLNAMNNQFWQDMRDCFGALDADPEVGIVARRHGPRRNRAPAVADVWVDKGCLSR